MDNTNLYRSCTILIGLLLGGVNLVKAQEYKVMMDDLSVNFYDVVDSAEAYFSAHDKGKGSGWKNYQRWKWENEKIYFPSGDRSQDDPYFAYREFVKIKASSPLYKAEFDSGWAELGPNHANNKTAHYSPGIGRVEAFYVDPKNTNHMYLGSRSGGFWRTSNGGTTWENTTDFLTASGVNTISVSATNSDSVFINVQNALNNASHGIYLSINGGATWQLSNFNPDQLAWGGLGTNDKVLKIVHHPTEANLIFIGTSKGLYRSTDNLQTWSRQFDDNSISDIEFHPTDPDIVYLFNNNAKTGIRISIDRGQSFPDIGKLTNNTSNGFIAVSPKCPDCVYFASNQGVWKSVNQGKSFTFLSNPNSSCDGFAVSDLDTSVMIYGYVDLYSSTDGGQNFSQITEWYNPGLEIKASYVHADLRTLECTNGVFYGGTDGYLVRSNDSGKTWDRLNDGTGIREFYSLGLSQSSRYVHIAGSQDNGTSILREGGWIEWNGGDGMECLVHPLNDNWLIGSWQYGGRNQTKDGGQTRRELFETRTVFKRGDWIAPLLMDPKNQMRIYHFTDTIFVSDDFGDNYTWTVLGTPYMGQIKLAAIAEGDPNKMLICRNADLQLSEDGGKTFRQIIDGLPGYALSDCQFDPRNDSTILVCYSRHQKDNQKIFISRDLGVTWENITFNLGDMPIRTLAVDHSQESIIYAGAEIGVYYKSMSDSIWTLYNSKLPNVGVQDLKIQYGTNLIKAATWGRGLWEYPLVNRSEYPRIISTALDDAPTDLEPGYPQYVTSKIVYDGSLSSVFVSFTWDTIISQRHIVMTHQGNNIWKSTTPIPSFISNTDVFFTVTAVGDLKDTTTTYRFMYKTRYGEATRTLELTARKDMIRVHPNPTSSFVTVELDDPNSIVSIDVLDVSGRLITRYEVLDERKVELELAGVTGLYTILVRAADGAESSYKVMKR